MKSFRERTLTSRLSSKNPSDSPNRNPATSACLELEPGSTKFSKASFWSSFFAPAFSIFEAETQNQQSAENNRALNANTKANGWTEAVRRVVTARSMWRLHDRVLGSSKTGICSSNSDIWLLGVCYKIWVEESSDEVYNNSLAAFERDFSSRILITYRKGFDTIRDSNFTSDVNWGCMLRSSQMLVAQALLFNRLGRSWRKPLHKPLERDYIEILHLFGDSEASAFSIHNLLQAGKAYGLAAGSWVGPYAMCRSWETLARCKREMMDLEKSLPMAIYVVSGDEDSGRGGAPVVCIEDAARYCLEFARGQCNSAAILLLVPLVLGLETVNPRYIPSLRATFSFPQSLGLLGGKPGASTYIVGVQDEEAYYLDPHEVQPAVHLQRDNLEADTSSYHSSVIRHIPLESLDPSLAIGCYCRDKDDFKDFCLRASQLAENSSGAPLFTVAQSHDLPKVFCHSDISGEHGGVQVDDCVNVMPGSDTEDNAHEDDWQFL